MKIAIHRKDMKQSSRLNLFHSILTELNIPQKHHEHIELIELDVQDFNAVDMYGEELIV